LLQELHGRCGELKAEIRALMLAHGIKAMRLMPVKRSYAFEDPAIPSREQWVIKVGRQGQATAAVGGVEREQRCCTVCKPALGRSIHVPAAAQLHTLL
jgi:hypothetical protein